MSNYHVTVGPGTVYSLAPDFWIGDFEWGSHLWINLVEVFEIQTVRLSVYEHFSSVG